MHKSTLDLFCERAEEEENDETPSEAQKKAAELGVSVDYYLSEFV